MSNILLDTESVIKLENRANELIKGVTHIIGVDETDGKFSYCLMRKEKHDNSIHIILAKTMKDEAQFIEEINNLAKYFNAIKTWEKD